MEYYKLVDAVTSPINVHVMTKRGNSTVYGHKRLDPGMAYEMPTDDAPFKESIVKATSDTDMKNKRLLDDLGIEYEVITPSCHCRKPYLRFKCVEVFQGELNQG